MITATDTLGFLMLITLIKFLKEVNRMKNMLIIVQKKLTFYFKAFHKKVYGKLFFIFFPYCRKLLLIQFHCNGKIASFAMFVWISSMKLYHKDLFKSMKLFDKHFVVNAVCSFLKIVLTLIEILPFCNG